MKAIILFVLLLGLPFPASGEEPAGEIPTKDHDVIMSYFSALAESRYRDAYALLCRYDLVITDLDGRKHGYQGHVQNFEAWAASFEEHLKSVEVTSIRAFPDRVLNRIGVRTYLVPLAGEATEGHALQNWFPSGTFIGLVTDTEGIVRIVAFWKG